MPYTLSQVTEKAYQLQSRYGYSRKDAVYLAITNLRSVAIAAGQNVSYSYRWNRDSLRGY